VSPLLDIARAARAFDAASLLPLRLAGRRIGWLAPDLTERLAAFAGVFTVGGDGVSLAAALTDPARRTAALATAVGTLVAEGRVTGIRHELYAVRQRFDDPPLFEIERAAARPFGFTTWAAHVNGVTDGGASMWIARRSGAKPIDPGMLDNLVGGGIAAGHGVAETVVKECWEEAGIAAPLARLAQPAGTVSLLRHVPEGVQSETIFVHDLWLPSDFAPRNTDGEVAGFERVAVAELPQRLAEGEFTCDSALVILDFLLRHGHLRPDQPGYDALAAAVRGSAPPAAIRPPTASGGDERRGS
jgi:8-oxo-dGTP pyrophosphatase MutT (NUDIX family)